ncbi:hypothetical protein VTN00DRAFT_8512 [Thermoascus crustaceus]|uniref:uncharacterized protein n=1 Tax=Thermoascus crustaceus TaxID=5088 RepID=UPI0037443DDE
MRLSPLSALPLLLAGAAAFPASPQSQTQNQHPLVQLDNDHASNGNRLDDVISASPLLSFHRDIVRIESVTGDEKDVGEFIISFLEARNFTVEKQIVPDNAGTGKGKERFNIYAYPASLSAPEILLTSHIDTVPPFIPYSLSLPSATEEQDETFNRDDILISGRGSVDAKASVAAQIFAVLHHLERDPSAKLGLLFVVGEELHGDGMKYFSDSIPTSRPTLREKLHTVIFGEPTDFALVSGHKGMLMFTITAKGQAAHSGYPWLGKSAVSAILPALLRLDKLGDIPVEEGGLPSSKKYGKTTLNIGFVQAGVATNVVPASAHADVAVRLAGGTVPQAKEIIRKAVRDATVNDKDVTVTFTDEGENANGNSYPPQDIDTDVPGFNVTTVNYGTDVPNLDLSFGEEGKYGRVKRYLYGPGSIFVAHGDHEGLRVWELEEAVRGYGRLIEAAVKRNPVS